MDITKDSKISEILSSFPEAATVFKRNGFFALMARLQKGTKDDTTIESACSQQGIDPGKLIEDLRSVCQKPQATATAVQSETSVININKKMKTTEVVNNYPAAKIVFIKYFGRGCFDCPAFGTEDVAFACLMHNTNADQFVKECIEAVVKEREAKAASTS